mgnify:CR=1 FL=1
MNEKQTDKLGSKKKSNYDLDLLLKLNEQMLLIRRFEEKAGQLYGMGKMVVFAIFILDKRLLLLVLIQHLKIMTLWSLLIEITDIC